MNGHTTVEDLVLAGREREAVEAALRLGLGSLTEVFSTADGFMEDRYDDHRVAILGFLRAWLSSIPDEAVPGMAEEVFGACVLGLAPAAGAPQVAAAYLRRALDRGVGDTERLQRMLADTLAHPDADG